MSEKPGSVVGGMLLISGSCIGAGMLGLPIVTGLAGFYPSLIMFFLAWLFMTLTGLLLIEVNGWFKTQVNLLTMVGHSLGKWGRGLCWLLYLFLFYSLLVAYTAGSGGLVSTFYSELFHNGLPVWVGSAFFVVVFGALVYAGTRPVDLWNRLFMVGMIIAYVGLVVFGLKHMTPALLNHMHLPYVVLSLPILVISFGFHNMIPSITAYMKGDIKRVRIAIIGGSLLALIIYLIWDFVVLGIVPAQGEYGITESLKLGREASQSIVGLIGASWVSTCAQGLAFFAILTSFLAQALALVHFWADGLKIKRKKKESIALCALTLIPPLFFSVLYPQIFYKALSFGGGICAVILFGVMPVLMVWIGRYVKKTPSHYRLMGGRPMLVVIALFALFIFFFQLCSVFGIDLFPSF